MSGRVSWIFLCVTVTMAGASSAAEPPATTDTRFEPAAVRPSRPISLFNGKDLSGLSTWLQDTKLEDPRKVFSVTSQGWLRISGEGFGYIRSREAYRDYRLIVEYKWGQRTDGGKFVRNAGILLNAVGPDGGAGGMWMSSVECQLAQGCVGDLIVIRGKDAAGEVIPVRLSSETALGPDKRPRWTPGGEAKTFLGGRQLWWSRHDPDFRELLDTRGKEDLESPIGEWTRVECVNEAGRLKIEVNGSSVNAAYDLFPASGKILVQSEGFELYVRRLELQPLP